MLVENRDSLSISKKIEYRSIKQVMRGMKMMDENIVETRKTRNWKQRKFDFCPWYRSCLSRATIQIYSTSRRRQKTHQSRAQTECVLSIRSIAMVITNSWRKILARVRQKVRTEVLYVGRGGVVRKRRHWFRLLSLIDTRAKITGKMLEAVRRGIGFKAGWNP